VEQVGGQMALDETEEKDDPEHLKQVMGSIESNIVRQLGKMDVGGDVIDKLEDTPQRPDGNGSGPDARRMDQNQSPDG
jgi:hypothetical protein